LVLRALPENDEIKGNLQQVVTATERGIALVEQILTFSRQTAIDRRPVLLGDVINEASALMSSITPQTIEVKTRLTMPKRRVAADPDQIHRMIFNLASNAVRAIGKARGRIELSLEEETFDTPRVVGGVRLPEGCYAKLSVSDDGVGIDEETLPHIFDPLFTTGPSDEGTGMGLAIVHGIAVSHNGAITVDSMPGEGTTFEVYLPILDNTEAAPPVQVPVQLNQATGPSEGT
jgi:signal transduction histidine kinase